MMKVEERILHLERRCRRLTAITVGLLAAAGLALLSGAAAPRDPGELRTQSLVVTDAQGDTRMHLGRQDEGYGLAIYDRNGRIRATLTDAPGGAVLSLRKGGGDVRLMALEGGAGLAVRDGQGKPRAVIQVDEKDVQLQLLDSDGTKKFEAP